MDPASVPQPSADCRPGDIAPLCHVDDSLATNHGRASVTLNGSRNLLVRRLGVDDARRLAPHFEEQSLQFKQPIFEQGEILNYVYFPETGVVSLLTELADGELIETGTVGNEGFAGMAAVLGTQRSSGRALCQIPGHALRLPSEVVAGERDRSSMWFRLLLRYVHFTHVMAAQSAACNRLHTVDARMSRWLLMTHDRVDGNDFPLTQELLAQMLGVARPTVNVAGATLQKAGFIKYRRGRITIVDRPGLESASCECYERIRQELNHKVVEAANDPDR
jgi:CRP-like cAMP-binding protein